MCYANEKTGKVKEVVKYEQGKHPNSNRFKGDEAGYYAIHTWVRLHKKKSDFCECCNKKKGVELANISGEYKRDVNDFEWLCRKCHMHKDGRALKVVNNLPNSKKICYVCSKEIRYEEKYVSLIDYNYGKINDQNHWHYQCWVDWFMQKVHARAEMIVKDMSGKVIGMVAPIMKTAKSLMGNDTDFKVDFIKKNKDGNRKKTGTEEAGKTQVF